jgi:hypothetical protein
MWPMRKLVGCNGAVGRLSTSTTRCKKVVDEKMSLASLLLSELQNKRSLFEGLLSVPRCVMLWLVQGRECTYFLYKVRDRYYFSKWTRNTKQIIPNRSTGERPAPGPMGCPVDYFFPRLSCTFLLALPHSFSNDSFFLKQESFPSWTNWTNMRNPSLLILTTFSPFLKSFFTLSCIFLKNSENGKTSRNGAGQRYSSQSLQPCYTLSKSHKDELQRLTKHRVQVLGTYSC